MNTTIGEGKDESGVESDESAEGADPSEGVFSSVFLSVSLSFKRDAISITGSSTLMFPAFLGIDGGIEFLLLDILATGFDGIGGSSPQTVVHPFFPSSSN